MRNCPHCNNEIQDEAVFCRFCRKEVDPPLWMTSLVKCPYCAEWVERGIDRCPLCGKAINTGQPFSVELEQDADPEAEDFLAKLRNSGLPEPEDDDLQAQEEPESTPAFYDSDPAPEEPVFEQSAFEPDSEPLEEPAAEEPPSRPASEPIEHDRGIKRTPSQPTDEGIAVLHSRRLDYESDFEGREESDTKPEEPEPSAIEAIVSGPLLRWAAIGITGAALVAIGIFLFPRIREALETIATPSSVAVVAVDEATPTSQPEGTATVSSTSGVGVLLPTPRATDRNCYQWDEISLEMAGQSVCAFGEIKRWFRVDEIPYVAIFSEEPGTFAIIDRGLTYPDYTPGTCITTTGKVEVMRGTRPFIEVDGDLETCE